MIQQIRQVALTYATQRYLFWGVLFVGVFFVAPQLPALAMSNREPDQRAQSLAMMLGMPLFFGMPFLVGHAKLQFAHSRARLMPQFLPAHVATLAVILVTAILAIPLAITACARVSPIGPIAFAFALAAPTIWGAHRNRFDLMLISLAVFYSLFTEFGVRWWFVEAPQHVFVHTAIILLGAAAVGAWLWRLCQLREEMDDYLGMNQWMATRRAGGEAVEQRRIVAETVRRSRFVGWIGDRWHDRLGGYFGGTRPGLVRLLRYGFGPNPVFVQAVFMTAMMFAMGIFFSQLSFMANGGFGALWFIVQFAVLLPGQMAGELLAQRRPRTAAELTLPIARHQLITGILTAAARNAIDFWFAMNVGVLIVARFMTTGLSPGASLVYLLISAATCCASAGLSMRISVWTSMIKRLMVLMPFWLVFSGPTMLWWILRDKAGDWPFVVVAAMLAALGVWLARKAHCAWCNIEFA